MVRKGGEEKGEKGVKERDDEEKRGRKGSREARR